MQIDISATRGHVSRDILDAAEDEVYSTGSIMHLAVIGLGHLSGEILGMGPGQEERKRVASIVYSLETSLKAAQSIHDRTASFLSDLGSYAMFGRPSGSRDLDRAIRAHEAAHSAWLAKENGGDLPDEGAEVASYSSAVKDLFSHKCASLEEVRRKVRHIQSSRDLEDWATNEADRLPERLLSSFLGEEIGATQ